MKRYCIAPLRNWGFHSLLDRAKLRKYINQTRQEINQKRKGQILVARDDAQSAAPFDSHTGGGHRLSTAGRNGLVVARRSAFEMVAKAFTVGGDVQSWIRVPRDTPRQAPVRPRSRVGSGPCGERRDGHDGVILIFVMRACTPGHYGAI